MRIGVPEKIGTKDDFRICRDRPQVARIARIDLTRLVSVRRLTFQLYIEENVARIRRGGPPKPGGT